MKKMLRLPAIFVLIVSTFVGSSPVLLAEAPDKPEVAPAAAANVNAKIESTTVLANNDSLIVAASVRLDENKKDSSNDAKIVEPPKATNSNSNETIPQHIATPNETEKHNKTCNSTTEQDDLNGCKESTTIATSVTKKTEVSKTESQMPKPSPDKNKKDDKDKDTKKKDDKEKDGKEKDGKEKDGKEKDGKEKDGKEEENVTIVPINATKVTDKMSYETGPAETSDVPNTNGTGDDAKPATPPATVNDTAMSNNTVVPLDKVANVEPVAVAEAKLADRNKSMPSGIIALVTAISFGVAIAIVYIGMIVWRRYVEYRYGHRELLVNELEFDTNDLRHFEL